MRKALDREKGSGLRLVIVRHLFRLMVGWLSIQSRESRSTPTDVMLPIATAEQGSDGYVEEK